MCGCVDQSAACQHGATSPTRRLGARSALVLAYDRRLVFDGVTGVPETRADVLVLAVHEEALVEAADLFQGGTTHEEARSRDPVDSMRLGVGARITDHLVG